MKHKFKIGLAILAVISLPGVLAFADHANGGCIGEQCQKSGFACLHGAWMMLIDDTTIDNFDNMTLAQIKALEQQKMQELDNLTLAEIKSLRQQKMHERENMTLAQARSEMVGSGYRCHGKMRPFPRGNSFGFRGGDFPAFKGGHFGLLMDDISTEELNNMTLAEIRDMRTQKIQELENMTIAEIEALKQKRIDELSNMTLSELKEYRAGMHGAMMGFAGMKHNWNDERHGRLA